MEGWRVVEREHFIYSSSEQMLSAVGVWMERCRDGEGELRDLKGLDGEEGGGCAWREVVEEVFQPSIATYPPSPPPPPPLPLFLLLLVLCEPQRRVSSGRGRAVTRARHQPKQKHNKRADL